MLNWGDGPSEFDAFDVGLDRDLGRRFREIVPQKTWLLSYKKRLCFG
jgi:hypothetical protein